MEVAEVGQYIAVGLPLPQRTDTVVVAEVGLLHSLISSEESTELMGSKESKKLESVLLQNTAYWTSPGFGTGVQETMGKVAAVVDRLQKHSLAPQC